MTYSQLKDAARQKAIEWQLDFSSHSYSMSELMDFSDYFYRLGKRFGLLGEFKENGIL